MRLDRAAAARKLNLPREGHPVQASFQGTQSAVLGRKHVYEILVAGQAGPGCAMGWQPAGLCPGANDHSLAAGAGTDIIGRLIQPVFTEAMVTQVVIRNVGGATGTIGTAEVVRAKPDGQTILLTSMAPIAIQPSFMARAPYRADQLTAVCLVAEAPATLMTPTTTGIKTVADIVARAKANPGQLP